MRPLILILLTGMASLALADEPFDPKLYVQQKCSSCHERDIYTRVNRKVFSYHSLKTQVQRCDAQLGMKMFPEEADAVADFLNDQYYHFKKD